MPRKNPHVLWLRFGFRSILICARHRLHHVHRQSGQPVVSRLRLRLLVPVRPKNYIRLPDRCARLPVRDIQAHLAIVRPFHNSNARHNRNCVGLVCSVCRLNQVHARSQPIHRQLLRLAHQSRRCFQLPSRHKLAVVQNRNLCKLRRSHHTASLAQGRLPLPEVVARVVRKLPAKESPHQKPQVCFVVVYPLQPRALINLLIRRLARRAKTVQVLQAGKELLRVFHPIHAELKLRHIPCQQLHLHALPRRKRPRRRQRKRPWRILRRRRQHGPNHEYEMQEKKERRVFESRKSYARNSSERFCIRARLESCRRSDPIDVGLSPCERTSVIAGSLKGHDFSRAIRQVQMSGL